jgi:hypothetical protein
MIKDILGVAIIPRGYIVVQIVLSISRRIEPRFSISGDSLESNRDKGVSIEG